MRTAGIVKAVRTDRGFGFISVVSDEDHFFHYRDLGSDLEFNETLIGHRVTFDVTREEKGPRARNIQPAK
jgi:cold shock CspA family protein